MGSEEQQRDALTAEEVAKRLEGKKRFEVLSRETVYYSRIVWADNEEEATDICHEECDYGDAVDYGEWQLDDCNQLP
jgi:hypothetical protein